MYTQQYLLDHLFVDILGETELIFKYYIILLYKYYNAKSILKKRYTDL